MYAIRSYYDQYDIWSSKKTGPKELNFVGFANDEVDRLLEEGRRTFDMEKRKKAYYRIQEILAEEQPYVFLYYPDALPAVHNRIHGIEPAPAGISYNFIKWYVPAGSQRYTTFHVITSYSIHYTKLYDSSLSRRMGGAGRRRSRPYGDCILSGRCGEPGNSAVFVTPP